MGPKANPKGAKGSKREARRDPSFKPRAWLEKGEAKGAKRCRRGCTRKPKGKPGEAEGSKREPRGSQKGAKGRQEGTTVSSHARGLKKGKPWTLPKDGNHDSHLWGRQKGTQGRPKGVQKEPKGGQKSPRKPKGPKRIVDNSMLLK